MLKLIVAFQLFVFTFLSEGSYLKMPSFSYPGESVAMECDVDHGDLPIVSITWLKDDQEFYKYEPRKPHKDLSRNGNKITLSSVSEESGGVYTCRVEIDNPVLNIGTLSGSLTIVDV
ncbi:hypothetical protein FQR65_LT13613 [Abscondita terminalis]|nr:hypothetical protein FQR65_LT13613 [Abscondita terminalis]